MKLATWAMWKECADFRLLPRALPWGSPTVYETLLSYWYR